MHFHPTPDERTVAALNCESVPGRLRTTVSLVEDFAGRPDCGDCGSPAQGHLGGGRWYCGNCERSVYAVTFINGEPLHVPNLEAFWRDPAPFHAEAVAGQARIDALFAAHDAKRRAEQVAAWAQP